MPKELFVDPLLMRKAARLQFPEIPIHAYATPLVEERQRYGDKTLLRVLRDMMVVREFETMLGAFKAQGAYAGIEFVYKGPAHLSIGQEGAAVGAALALKPNDHVFGSHRSHGEFIAKGLAAIAGLEPAALQAIMEEHQGGALLRTVEAHLGGGDETATAENFLLLGLLAEIFMRSNGFNGGMGGSMHAFFLPFGAYPNNAIVGASAGIATGSAMHKRLGGEGGISVAYAGDGSTGCGPVWEAMNFASMAQLNGLWPEEHRGGLPVLFCFNNNFYAMGGQTIGETAGWDRLSRIGAGINPAAMHAETVDGANPLAVADAVARKRALLVAGKGPGLLDIECYRALRPLDHRRQCLPVARGDEGVGRSRPDRAVRGRAEGSRHPRRGGRGRSSRGRRRPHPGGDPGGGRSGHRSAGRYPQGSDADRQADVLQHVDRASVGAAGRAGRSDHLVARPPARQEGALRPRREWRAPFADARRHHPRRAVRGAAPPLHP